MSTIKDVALRAGVSVATVSRVINHSGRVNEETRERVEKAVRELSYAPNLLGKNLRRLKTNLVIVLVPSLSNPFFSAIIRGIESVAHAADYNVMVCTTGYDEERVDLYVEYAKNKLADRVIFLSHPLVQYERRRIKEIPVVMCCECNPKLPYVQIDIDHEQAAYDMTVHLLSRGYRRIALIGCENTFSTRFRIQGYRRALLEHGIQPEEGLVRYCPVSFRRGYETALSLLSEPVVPEAVFALSDTIAAGVLRAARERRLRVPEELGVCGCDNISFSTMVDPPLTTISQPRYQFGVLAMEKLLRLIRRERVVPKITVLKHQIEVRSSTERRLERTQKTFGV